MSVYPRQALEAEREVFGDNVRSVFAIDPDDGGRYLLGGFSGEVFDLLFVPAKRLDALIEAARWVAVAYKGPGVADLAAALRAYDEGQEQ